MKNERKKSKPRQADDSLQALDASTRRDITLSFDAIDSDISDNANQVTRTSSVLTLVEKGSVEGNEMVRGMYRLNYLFWSLLRAFLRNYVKLSALLPLQGTRFRR